LFKKDRVEFLGMEVSLGTIRVSEKKIKVIIREKPPTNKKGVRQFLGLTNYHCRFIKDYSKKARPLHDLTWDIPFVWTDEC
jgi:hypothetical protein